MEYVEVQDSKVPAIGFGTWQLKDRECRKAVENALELGYRHIDTAQVYGNEAEIGRAIKESRVARENVWVTTKIWRDNLNQENLRESVHESLEKLQTNYVDLLLIHWPFPEINTENCLQVMTELVEEEKAFNLGVSNFTSRQLEEAVESSPEPILTNQIEYHPFLDQSKILEKCQNQDIMLTAYSPLARGEVIGNETLKEIGSKYSKTEAQVALRWLTQQKNVGAIPKASSREYQGQNLNIFDFELTSEEMEQIHRLKGNERKLDPDFAPNWD